MQLQMKKCVGRAGVLCRASEYLIMGYIGSQSWLVLNGVLVLLLPGVCFNWDYSDYGRVCRLLAMMISNEWNESSI